jgi:2-methylisocitrate lyase-like PEP mutase family enzyme
MSRQAAAADAFRALHADPALLVIPNAWDAASARAVQAAGFPSVATSSGAVARTLGYDDGEAMPADEAFAAVARITRSVDVPLTADLEAGYGLEPAEFAARLVASGAVGCNYEDTDHHGAGVLVDADRQAERVAAVKAAARVQGVDIVLNARVDTYVNRIGSPEETLAEAGRRGRLYLEAGADCVYPIGVADEAAIAQLVQSLAAPVNVMVRPGTPSVARLAELGVARATFGSGLFTVALRAFEQALADLGGV